MLPKSIKMASFLISKVFILDDNSIEWCVWLYDLKSLEMAVKGLEMNALMIPGGAKSGQEVNVIQINDIGVNEWMFEYSHLTS